MKIIKFPLLIVLTMTFCVSCHKTNVDLIVTNATVYTVDEAFSTVESFAVNQGKIVALGTTGEIGSKFRAARSYDMQGKFVYPGFNDAHAHFFGYGTNLLQNADLSGALSPEEVYDILEEHYARFGGDWLTGRGWDQNNWPDKSFPDKTELDKRFPGVAVYLVRVDGHAAWCNSKALQNAQISGPVNILGGEVVTRDGLPTGILIDKAMALVSSAIPEHSLELKGKALKAAQEKCLAAGLTSVTDCGLSKQHVLLIDSLHHGGELKIRINAMLDPNAENFEHFVKKGRYQTDRLMVSTIKLYADGALGSRGALLIDPYTDDPSNQGLQMATGQSFRDICELAYQHNYQVATHCIGDSANRLILHIYGEFLKGHNDRRWRIEHAQVVHPDDFDLFGKYSIVPSVQATHATNDMDWAIQRLGQPRIKGAYAYQQLLQQNGWLPNGTDFPVEGISPLHTFFSAVFRTHHDGSPAGGFQMENALSGQEALRSMTIWPAKASFEEKIKGSLQPGKWADFVVLDTDLMTATPEQVLSTKTLSTWIAGEMVFECGW